MDITGLIAGGLGQQGVDHADHRRAVLSVEQVGDLGHVLHQAVEVDFVFGGTDHRSGAAGVGIGAGEQAVEFVVAHLFKAALAELTLHFADRPAGVDGQTVSSRPASPGRRRMRWDLAQA